MRPSSRITECAISASVSGFLKSELRRDGEMRTCSYCHKKRHSIRLSELADRFEEVFEDRFQSTSDRPSSLKKRLRLIRKSLNTETQKPRRRCHSERCRDRRGSCGAR